MQELEIWKFSYVVHELAKFLWIAHHRKEDDEVPEGLMANLLGLAEDLEHLTKELQLKASHERAAKGLRWALRMSGHPKWAPVKTELRVLWEVMEPELRQRRFASIEAAKDEYLDQVLGDPPSVSSHERRGPSQEWLDIFAKFRSARVDIEEAVYCYVLERNTAAVFHAMRMAEHGLRSLARRLHVRLTHRGKNQPIEYADWAKVITGIKNKLNLVSQSAQGPSRQHKLELYSDMADHCVFMKDIWRNNVSHARKPYNPSEALSVLERVKEFMLFLARNYK